MAQLLVEGMEQQEVKVRPSRQPVGKCDQMVAGGVMVPRVVHILIPRPMGKEESVNEVIMATSKIAMQSDDVDDEREKQNPSGPLLSVTTKHGQYHCSVFS